MVTPPERDRPRAGSFWFSVASAACLLSLVVNVVAGEHYARADGGFASRTQANHLAGWAYLAAAALTVVIGLAAVAVRPAFGRRAAAAMTIALLVGIGGAVTAHTIITDSLSCACEGG